jgi:1,4-dihydroxy-2-naphthoyl-CoA synthase
MQMSPTTVAVAARSINIDNNMIRGISSFAMHALKTCCATGESKVRGKSIRAKRNSDLRKHANK